LNNTVYPTGYSNGILDLGTFENKNVEIELVGLNENAIKYLQFGILDINKYNKVFEENENKIHIEVNSDTINIKGYSKEDKKLLIPINYDKGWRVSNNSNQEPEIKRVYNNFIGLEIKQGNVDIKLKFRPIFYNFGLIITILSIIIMVILHFIKLKLKKSKILLTTVAIIGFIIHIICFIIVYVISILETFIH